MTSPSDQTPPEIPDATSPGAERARILIVEDNERNAFAAVEALQELGHELVVAGSGEDALRELLDGDFAVILLDVHMPRMDGYETAALIRARRRTRDVPIVFLTAIAREEHHLFQAYQAGAVDVVFKPVDPFILRSKVKVFVDLHLKTRAVERESEHRKRLLDENERMERERAAAERALKIARVRQQAILSLVPVVTASRAVEPPFATLFLSDNAEGLTGFPAERFVTEPQFGFERVHPEDREALSEALRGAVTRGSYSCEFRWLHADGTYRTFLDQGVLGPAEEGRERELLGTLLDVTDRRSLEEQLAQARKMEAVGQLTGGVAHDFNNLLTVVFGNVDMLKRKIDDERQRQRLDYIRQAAERGRGLTQQLLAFSRRQQLSPAVVDPNRLIEDFAPLVRQAVGEAVTVVLDLCADPLAVKVDPAQLETAILNLSVNARDAMAGGGTVTVRTGRIDRTETLKARYAEASGDCAYVFVEVRDTGSGMDEETRRRIFEPFFTTKEVGKGSGLGLSQVYGFVRQSEGFVAVESEPGKGAVFTLYLRECAEALDAPVERAAGVEVRSGGERVLVVEDDLAVQALAVDLLEELGYSVRTASNGADALDLLQTEPVPDLLLTDVMMPGGMNGLELARQALELRPGLKVLLTSGYVGDLAPVHDAGHAFVEKPYERERLAAKLREVLAGAPPRRKGERRSRRVQAAPAAE